MEQDTEVQKYKTFGGGWIIWPFFGPPFGV